MCQIQVESQSEYMVYEGCVNNSLFVTDKYLNQGTSLLLHFLPQHINLYPLGTKKFMPVFLLKDRNMVHKIVPGSSS